MSSPMAPPMGRAPRPGGPPPGPPGLGGGMQSKMSLFNPTDMAAKLATGDVGQNQTVADFLQKNFGVSPNDPLQKLLDATKSQMQNRTLAGKLGVQPGAGGRPSPAPPSAPTPSPAYSGPPPGPPPGPAPRGGGGLDGLVSRM